MNKRTSILVQPQPLGKNTLNEIQIASLDANYDESAAITSISVTSTQIDLKIGDKINIAGQSLEINADASAGDRNLTIVSITLTAPITIGNEIRINEENLFEQYQRKTEGTVGGFIIDSNSMVKDGVIIQGFLDNDAMIGATANNLPTAESVKAYVDGQVGASDTLQEVLALGNTSGSNDIAMDLGQKVYFNNANENIFSNVNGDLQINARTELRIKGNSNNTNGVELSFWNGGTEKMRITSAGNVLIGGTSDSDKLVVEDSSAPNIRMYRSGTGQVWQQTIDSSGRYMLREAASAGGTLYTRLQIDDSGEVEVFNTLTGTTATFSGQVTIPATPVATTDAASKSYVDAQVGASDTLQEVTDNGNTTTNSVMIGSSSSPGHLLHVYGGSSATAQVQGNSGLATMRLVSGGYTTGYDMLLDTGGTAYLWNRNNGNLSFGTNNAERMRITSAGNVGISTTSPTEKLHVVGDTFIDGGLKVNAANIDFTGLGTTDPGLAGRLWNDRGDLKISEG